MTLKIHVGAHKTATTALQDAFASKSADLRALGVSYIGPSGPGHGYGSLSSALSGHSREALSETVRIIRQNMAGDDLVVISDENILGVLKHAPQGGRHLSELPASPRAARARIRD